jgi:hypothetical protein
MPLTGVGTRSLIPFHSLALIFSNPTGYSQGLDVGLRYGSLKNRPPWEKTAVRSCGPGSGPGSAAGRAILLVVSTHGLAESAGGGDRRHECWCRLVRLERADGGSADMLRKRHYRLIHPRALLEEYPDAQSEAEFHQQSVHQSAKSGDARLLVPLRGLRLRFRNPN